MNKDEIILSLEEIAAACDGQLYKKGDKEGVTGVVIDNRILKEGELFVAVKGERTDGHRFINAAFEAGAACVLTENEPEEPKGSYICVRSSLQALRDIATYYRSTLKIPVIGVTGSVGKTGTKEMTAAVLSQKFNTHKTAGNFNNDIGLPLTLLGIRSFHEAAVVEMGISGFGEMDLLARIAKPDMMIFTNIRECHLEFLHDLDGVLKAKTEVLDSIDENAPVIINADDIKLLSLWEKSESPNRFISFGQQRGDIIGTVISNRGLDGTDVEIESEAVRISAHISLPGAHNIYHALAATAVGLKFGIAPEDISRGIESIHALGGRNNIIELSDGIKIIDDCYNASPASVNSAIHTLSASPGRKTAILGDMGELGDDEVELHADIGNNAGFFSIDRVYTVGKLSQNIILRLKELDYKGECKSFESPEEAEEQIIASIEPNEVILVKASHFMGFDRIVEAIKDSLGKH